MKKSIFILVATFVFMSCKKEIIRETTTIHNNNTNEGVGPFSLGKDTLGGIVYYIYIGSDGNQHGLIVNKNQTLAKWQDTATLINADRTEDGAYNTSLMINSTAATYVRSFGGDWFLPSIDELALLYNNRFLTNKALREGGFTLLTNTDSYWSSTERTATNSFGFFFDAGYVFLQNKGVTLSVRAVRSF